MWPNRIWKPGPLALEPDVMQPGALTKEQFLLFLFMRNFKNNLHQNLHIGTYSHLDQVKGQRYLIFTLKFPITDCYL